MKIKMILFFGLFFGYMGLNAAYVPHHMKTEKQLRKELYCVYENNPYFYKMQTCEFFKDIDFYILTLKAHIKKLQGKIAQNKGFFESNSFKRGMAWLSPLLVCITATGYGYNCCANHDRSGVLFLGALLSVYALIPGVIGIQKLNKRNNYPQRYIDRLQRDKRLLAIFELEKRKQEENKSNTVLTN